MSARVTRPKGDLMFTRLTSTFVAAGLLLIASAAAAQPNLAAGLDNVLRAPQGTWAEYKMSKSAPKKHKHTGKHKH